MESRHYIRFLIFFVGVATLLAFTWSNLPYAPPNATESLDCATYSSWCTSKNRFQDKPLTEPHKSTLRRRYHIHASDTPRHPLDPLTIKEINRLRTILSSHALFKNSSPYALHSVSLKEPEKSLVLNWTKGDSLFPRKAYVVARVKNTAYVLTVDLETEEVTVHETDSSSSGYPTMTIEDMTSSTSAPLANAEFNRTIIERGVDLKDLACLPISSGWYGEKVEENRRLIKVQCYSMKDTVNFYMRPIEGLTVLLDIDTKEVVEITDKGKNIPIAKAANTDYRYSAQGLHRQMKLVNPISLEQPEGPSFVIEDGHLVKWANWEFHLKSDPRAGVIVSQARVRDPDSGEMRNVMYKGFSSELFVPYMDPTDAWYFKTYMDAGEYGFGLQAMPLDPLNDCPRNAYYMDGVFAAADGTPYIRSNMICVFERYAGDIGWRHAESPITGMKITEVRPKVTLVVRMAASVANYDYIVDWEFQTDGLIRIKVGLSGILMVKGTPYENMNQISEKENEELFGTLLSENIIGVIHDHYVTFYLDMDIDGSDNSFVKVNIKRQETSPGESPRKSYLKAVRNVAKTEKDAQIKLKLYDPAEFHVINPTKKTRLGNPFGYKVVAGGTAASLLDHEDPPQKRGAFTNNQIWVTPYNESEQWAGGLLVYQSKGERKRKMGMKKGLVFALMFGLFVFRVFGADDSTTAECSDDFQKVMICLDYARGKITTPSKECCSSVKGIKDSDPKCLCYIIQQAHTGSDTLKNMGVEESKLLQLPSACQLQNASITNCPKLLGLSPSSPDAAIFSNGSSAASPAGTGASTSPSLVGADGSLGTMHGPYLVGPTVTISMAIFFYAFSTGFASLCV